MENSKKNSGRAEIPKGNRSLDLKSLYKSSVPEVAGSEKKLSKGNEHVDVKKKKRKSRKEFLLSRFESDAKKSRKEDSNAVKASFDQESSGGSKKGLHGISLSLSASVAFNFPKRPRGSLRRRKLESNQISQPVGYPDSGDHEGAINETVVESEDKVDQLVNLVSLSAGTESISNTNSAGKVRHSNSKSKKNSLKSKCIASTNSIKLKRKYGEDEVKESGNSRSGALGHSEKEDDRAVNNGDTSSAKCRLKKRNKKDEVKESGKNKSGTVGHSEKEAGRAVNNGDTSSAKHHNKRIKEDEVKQSCNSRSGTVGFSGKEDDLTVNNGEMSSAKLRNKNREDKVKESGNSRSVTVRHSEKENDLGTSSAKGYVNSRKKKRKVLVVRKDGSEVPEKKIEHSMGSSVADSIFINMVDDDDDEENLEENAARMLSSRFDPTCAGFLSKRESSASLATNGFSFPVAARGSFNRLAKSPNGVGSASADDASRSLRPKTEEKGKAPSRKRRHFYEILPADLDAYWVLNRRIKVFWPLDDCWYDGLLNAYNPEIKLHHIKYDDREEEWVNLEQEKFKLLLLPCEVPEKSKPKRQRSRKKIVQEVKTVSSSDDDSCTGNDLDSQPIATWLACSSQRFKSLPLSFKKQRTMQMLMASSLSSEKTTNLRGNVPYSNAAGNNPNAESALADVSLQKEVYGSLHEDTDDCQNIKNLVYVRKKCSKKNEFSSLFGGAKARINVPGLIGFLAPRKVSSSITKVKRESYGGLGPGKQFWFIDNRDELRSDVSFLTSADFRLQVCMPVFPYLEFSCGTFDFGLLHDILLLQYGYLVATSPAINLEILFIDNNHGLRFLLFEGCLNQASAFIFLILCAFSQPDEQKILDIQLPVTSIRFRISGTVDVRKRHVFAFYCFSRLQSSKWLSLNSKLMQQCHLIKELPVSQCTYNNIKDLESRNSHLRRIHVDLELSSSEGCKGRILPGILPMGVNAEAGNRWMSPSTFSLDAEPGRVSHSALSFSAAPSFFLNLHFQLLTEHSFAWVHLQHHDSLYSPENSKKSSRFMPTSSNTLDVPSQSKLGKLSTKASDFGGFSSSGNDLGSNGDLAINLFENVDSFIKLHGESPNGAGRESSFFKEFNDKKLGSQSDQRNFTKELHMSSVAPLLTSVPPTSRAGCDFGSGGMIVVIPPIERVDQPFDGKRCISSQTSDADWGINDGFAHSPCPTVSRSLSQRGRSCSISSLGDLSPVCHEGKTNFLHMGLSNGPKKPRTQVQYTLPFAGNDPSTKKKVQNQRPCKRIRKASLKNISDGSRSKQKNLDSLACYVNVLVNHEDKGWRECGANVLLEVADHHEWRLAVKFSGITKYSYKVKHILQPGSTNRISHAMMWKGGKDWVLEFPDRSQWMLFKEMHEECYNRNIRAASVKNIPIPGVQLIEDTDDYGTETSFVRNPMKYFRQVQTDVEMALDPSHILYDLDSDDELWLMENRKDAAEVGYQEISEELLEKTIVMFEKASYIQQLENFTDAEIEELVIGVGSVEAAKVVYDHWRQKRERKGMPLIRHLQPPLWVSYQQKLEWEKNVPRGNVALSVGSQEKASPAEKPPVFAFCLKPRGLDVPNKGSKQRSQRKFPVSALHHAASGDSDIFFGRRTNGHAFGDENVLCAGSWNDYSDVSPARNVPAGVLSPRDVHFSLSTDPYEWNRDPKFYKNKSKKQGSYSYLDSQQMIPNNQQTMMNRNGVQQWNMGSSEYSRLRPYCSEGYHRQGLDQLDDSELDEFRLRDASSAAKHARNVAKLKRERAQRMLYRADLFIHRAIVTLRTAEAIKASNESSKDHK